MRGVLDRVNRPALRRARASGSARVWGLLGAAAGLGEPDGAWAGAVAPYSLIHVETGDRPAAYAELARVIAPDGWLLLAFHVSMANQPVGSVRHFDDWFGRQVDLDFHFLDPDDVAGGVVAAGFTVMAITERQPWPHVEAPSRRCTILAQRSSAWGQVRLLPSRRATTGSASVIGPVRRAGVAQ